MQVKSDVLTQLMSGFISSAQRASLLYQKLCSCYSVVRFQYSYFVIKILQFHLVESILDQASIRLKAEVSLSQASKQGRPLFR